MANKNINGDVNVSFTEAQSRQSLESGESVKTLFGKLRKWLSDLKAIAFSEKINLTESSSYTRLRVLSPDSNNGLSATFRDTEADIQFAAGQTDTKDNWHLLIDSLGNAKLKTNNGAIAFNFGYTATGRTDTIGQRSNDSTAVNELYLDYNNVYIDGEPLSTKTVRYDTNAQGLTAAQKTNARANIGAETAEMAMTGYTKPSSTSAITTSDTLNEAIGKLEKGLDGAGGGTIPPFFINKISYKTSVNPSVTYYVKFYYEESKLESNPITFRVIGGIINSSNYVNCNLYTACITKEAYKVSNISENNFTVNEYRIIGRYTADNIDSDYRLYYPSFWNSAADSAMWMYISGKNVYKNKDNTIIHSIMPIDFTAVTRVTYNDITIWERTEGE